MRRFRGSREFSGPNLRCRFQNRFGAACDSGKARDSGHHTHLSSVDPWRRPLQGGSDLGCYRDADLLSRAPDLGGDFPQDRRHPRNLRSKTDMRTGVLAETRETSYWSRRRRAFGGVRRSDRGGAEGSHATGKSSISSPLAGNWGSTTRGNGLRRWEQGHLDGQERRGRDWRRRSPLMGPATSGDAALHRALHADTPARGVSVERSAFYSSDFATAIGTDLEELASARHDVDAGFKYGIKIESKTFDFSVNGDLLIRESKGRFITSICFDFEAANWLRDSTLRFRRGNCCFTRYEDNRLLQFSFHENRFGGFFKLLEVSESYNILIIPEGRGGHGWFNFQKGLQEAVSFMKELRKEKPLTKVSEQGDDDLCLPDILFGSLGSPLDMDSTYSISTKLLHADLELLSGWETQSQNVKEVLNECEDLESNISDENFMIDYDLVGLSNIIKERIGIFTSNHEAAEKIVDLVVEKITYEQGFFEILNDMLPSAPELKIAKFHFVNNRFTIEPSTNRMVTRQQARTR